MRRAARATSAAPTYFEPANVTVGDQQRVLVDGGVFVNNPAVSTYAEAERHCPDETIRVVSIGTGSATEPIGYDEAQEWGKLGWAVETIDIVFDGVSDAADYQLRHVLGDRFERFQVPLGAASDAMDDASPENLEALLQDAERMMETQADALAALCNRLDGNQ
jgi:patatin-like phospholipase/acyl hydrolase